MDKNGSCHPGGDEPAFWMRMVNRRVFSHMRIIMKHVYMFVIYSYLGCNKNSGYTVDTTEKYGT